MSYLQFERPDGSFIQCDNSLHMISYISGVIAALGVLGYTVLEDEESGKYQAWQDGSIKLLFWERKGKT